MPGIPFKPQESSLNIAKLRTIPFSALFKRDEKELVNLLQACEQEGFFYLDLCDNGSRKMLGDLGEISGIMKDWFAQPLESKLKTETVSNVHGYKPTGVQPGVTASSKDGFEVLKVCRQELNGRWALPDVVLENFNIFDDFVATSNFLLKTILDCISDSLSLKGLERLDTYHRDDSASESTLYCLHYPPAPAIQRKDVGQNMHTDIGTLTLLFAMQWGLQVLSPTSNSWEYVEPRPGHAIINVGDTLRFLSKRRLRSALHRVLPIEGLQNGDRYSIAYFLRAGDNTEFEDSDGTKTDAKSWCAKKHMTFELPHEEQKKGTTLTGGMLKY